MTTSQTVASASAVLGELAGVAEELSTSLDVSILGQRPLTGAAQRFGELAVAVEGIQDDTDRLAANLGANAVDVTELAAEISRLGVRLDVLTSRVESFDRTGEITGLLVAGIGLIGLLVGWLAVGAVGCAWVGWRLRSGESRQGAVQPPVA